MITVLRQDTGAEGAHTVTGVTAYTDLFPQTWGSCPHNRHFPCPCGPGPTCVDPGELLPPLLLPMAAQTWNGAGFGIRNGRDKRVPEPMADMVTGGMNHLGVAAVFNGPYRKGDCVF